MIEQAPRVTVSDLLLTASRAEWNERFHQRDCRARAESRECVACLEYETDWIAAERAVAEFVMRVS